MHPTNDFYGNVLIPLAYLCKGDFRFYYYNLYKRNLLKTQAEIKDYQTDRIKKLVKHAYETVPYYHELFDKLNIKCEDIQSPEDLSKLPVLDKKTLIREFNRLKSKKKYTLLEETSGGSTGNRVVVMKDKRYYEISRAICIRDLYSIGINPGDKGAWIWGSPIENDGLRGSIFQRLLWKINRRIILNATHYKEEDLTHWFINDFNKFKPDYIYGYANSVYEVAKSIEKNKIQVHQVKLVVTTSEKLEHRDYIEKVFKCKVFDQYGSREIDEIAIDDKNQVMHSTDDFVYVEVDNEGKILLSPLESYGMPLLRYSNGDRGEKKRDSTKQSTHPFSEFNISIGRICELLRNKNNEKLSPLVISVQFGREKLNLGELQVLQKDLDNIELKVVKFSDYTDNDLNRAKEILIEKLGKVDIKIVYVDEFPVEKSGKKLFFKSLVKDENTDN